MTLGQSAANAEFTLDGVAFSRATNIVDDVVSGMSLTLKKAAPGQGVDIGADRPLDMIKQTVGDFVSVYNQLKKSLSAASSLSGSTTSLRELERELSSLVGKVISSHGSINKLTDIGISTTKDGLLSVDNAKLTKALETDAGAVEEVRRNRAPCGLRYCSARRASASGDAWSGRMSRDTLSACASSPSRMRMRGWSSRLVMQRRRGLARHAVGQMVRLRNL